MTEIKANEEMCAFCFDVIMKELKMVKKSPQISLKGAKAPLFVTFMKKSSGGKYDLRGCIGTFQKADLAKNLRDYAKNSAFKDSRFNPISKSEVKNLQVEVSILTNFEEGKDSLDWEIGKHGIIIKIKDPFFGQMREGTFLPEVMVEQKWNKKQTLRYLLKKARYSQTIDDSVLEKISLERYQSSKFYMTYQEYLEYKKKIETILSMLKNLSNTLTSTNLTTLPSATSILEMLFSSKYGKIITDRTTKRVLVTQ